MLKHLFWNSSKPQGLSLIDTWHRMQTLTFHGGLRALAPAGKEMHRGPLLLLLVFFYWTIIYLLGSLRSDHILICSFALTLYYWKIGTRKFLKYIAPMIFSGILYDSMRHYADYIRGPVHVAQPYLLEKFLFGITTASGVLTPNEFFQINTYPVLDFFCGFAYLVFIFEYIFLCIYFYLGGLYYYLIRATWAFFFVNLFGYITYYVYAAAPPWYVAMHGLGPAKMDTLANPAGAIRFDQLLGTSFFTDMYGKSADVFGAIPSLHVTYPFMAMVFAIQMKRFRLFSILFFILMCFSAVYLNHHYILDVLVGLTYAVITLIIVESYYNKKPLKPYER